MLALSESLDSQLARFARLRSEDAEAAQQQHEINERLIILCQEGSYRKVKDLVEREGPKLMTYFVVRAFKAALMGCHLVLVDFLLCHGYPLNSASVPFVLLEVISDMIGPNKDEMVVSILQFLISKNWNVNMQASKTWVSALHMTVQGSLLEASRVLLLSGADINSVASGDAMPLTIADQVILSLTQRKEMVPVAPGAVPDALSWGLEQEAKLQRAHAVRALLLAHGAKSSWKRDIGDSSVTGSYHGYSAGSEQSSESVARSGGNAGGAVRFAGGSPLVAGSGLVRMTGGGGGLVRFAAGSNTSTPPLPPQTAILTEPLVASLGELRLGGARASSGAGADDDGGDQSNGQGEGEGKGETSASCRVVEDGAWVFSTGS